MNSFVAALQKVERLALRAVAPRRAVRADGLLEGVSASVVPPAERGLVLSQRDKTHPNGFIRTLSLLLSCAAFLICTGAAFAADATNKPAKVSGQIRYHQQLKTRPAGVSDAQHKKDVQARGLKAEKLDREEVSLYVTRPLTAAEVQAFKTRGIEIQTNNWVPSVPGKHAHGFYLAEVPYHRLDELEQDARITRVASTEIEHQPHNDVASIFTGVLQVQLGIGLNSPHNGAGVRIAIADSSCDLTHPDFTNNPPFETYDVTTGSGTNNWSTSVAPVAINHGTHVSGTVVGSGTNSGGAYRGAAPNAPWAFYKIGNNVNATTTAADEIKAINRAVAVNCKIFTMSYGGLAGGFLDGSESVEQAVDAAVAAGVTVFISAGNNGAGGIHQSRSVAPGTTTPVFTMTFANGSANTMTTNATITVLWRDGGGSNDNNMVLSCNNLGVGESLTSSFSDMSSRNTERRFYTLTAVLAGSQTKTFNLQLQNTAPSGVTPLVHCYSAQGNFVAPDRGYTVGSPAVADGAIAVAAYAHRANYLDCNGTTQNFGETVGQITSFSSRGPRIDGLQKPDVAAPGSIMISTISLNNNALLRPDPVSQQVANVGVPGCSYLALQGTSMACPHAAGIGALILSANPSLTPAEVRTLLTTGAANPAARDFIGGYGLVNAYESVRFAELNLPGVWVSFPYFGTEEGNFDQPFNTLVEALDAAPSAAPVIIPRVRIKAGNSPSAIQLTKPVRLESYGGTTRLGP